MSGLLYDAAVAEGTRRLFSAFFSTPSASSITTTNNWRIGSPSIKINININSTFFQIALVVGIAVAVALAAMYGRKKITETAKRWAESISFW